MTLGSISLGLPELIAGILMVVVNAYVLTGGADFGGGLWDLLARGPRAERQRALIAESIAPIWEANHVWLIVAVVVLFTAFPPAFSAIAIALHIPIALMLIGIVLRGSAFVFRAYGSTAAPARRRWGVLFAGASAITPMLLGILVGTVASGDIDPAAATHPASFTDVFVRPWLSAFPIAVGIFTLFLFAFLAAVYLALRADDAELREDFRRRALGAAFGVFMAAAWSLVIALSDAPAVPDALLHSAWAPPFQIAVGLAAIIALAALWTRRYRLARIAAAGQVSLILWGWAFAQFPDVLPRRMTIRQAAAPTTTLELVLIGLVAGSLILIPSLRYLFRVFPPRHDAAATAAEPDRAPSRN
jgi:cytochrome d ubiquinol oxidase subunit II